MNPPEGEQKIILVVQDRELFTVLLRGFSSDYFEVLFAEGPTDALSVGSLRNLRLVTVPVDSEAGVDLAWALKEVSGDITVLGTTARSQESLGGIAGCVDQVVARSDLKEVGAAARGWLGERRELPRVMVDFPVKFGDGGIGIVKDLSATSMLVETMLPLEEGELVQVEVGEGDAPFQFEARGGRMQRSALGKSSQVLRVSEETGEVRGYLEQLVWKLMEVQYYLNGNSSRPGVLRGPMSWEMARRVERNLRESDELRIVSADKIAEEPPTDRVESRYRLGRYLGQWGVGEVYLASHLLLKRPVAIKILREDLRGMDTARGRMEREAIVPSSVNGPCVVDIKDFGNDGHGGLFYAMEALTGETLASAVERGQVYSARDIARLGLHLATTLAVIHLRGHGHFDICPQNVFLQKLSVGPGWPLLINIGGCPADGGLVDTHPMGVDFWPPEAYDEQPGPKHDIYGLGALLEYLCRHAADGDKKGIALLREGISRATTTDPEDRYPDMNVMAHAVVQCWEALEATASAEDVPQIESPHDLKKVLEQSASEARSFSSQFIAEAMATFAAAAPRPEEPTTAEMDVEVGETPVQSSPKASPDSDVEVEAEGSPPEVGGEVAAVDDPTTAPPARTTMLPPVWAVLLVLGALAIGAGVWLELESQESSPAGLEAPPASIVPHHPEGGQAEARPETKLSGAIDLSKSKPVVLSGDQDKAPQPRPDAAITAAGEPDARPDTAAANKPGRAESAKGGQRRRLAAIQVARALIKSGKYAEARGHLETALQIQDSIKLRLLLSRTCEKEGLHQQAIDHLQKVAALRSDVAWYQDKLGRLYLKVGSTGLACQAFKRALRILPTYPVSRGNYRKYCR